MKIATRLRLLAVLAVLVLLFVGASALLHRESIRTLQSADEARQLSLEISDLATLASDYLGFGNERIEQQWDLKITRLKDLPVTFDNSDDHRRTLESLAAIDAAFQELKATRHRNLAARTMSRVDDVFRIEAGELELGSFIRAEARRTYTLASESAKRFRPLTPPMDRVQPWAP